MLARLQRFFPPRLRLFFWGGETLAWESSLSPEEIKERLRGALRTPHRDFWTETGCFGRVQGDSVCIAWRRGMTSNSFAHVFYGTLEAWESGGTVLRGTFSGSRLSQILVALWMTPLVLAGLAMIWTLIVPLAVWGMLWVMNGMMCFADGFIPQQQNHVGRFLTRVCDPNIPANAISDVPDF